MPPTTPTAMTPLLRLRRARRLACGVLLWFTCYLGLAIAAPLLQPRELQQVCSATSAAQAPQAGTEGQGSRSPSLDCPLCTGVGAPPPLAYTVFTAALPLSNTGPWHTIQAVTSRSAAPPPARGPPAHA